MERECWQAAHDQQREEKDRHGSEPARLVEQQGQVERDSGCHKEPAREAEGDRIELHLQQWMGHFGIAIERVDDDAGDERAE